MDPLTTLVIGLNSKEELYVVIEEAIPSVFDDNPFILSLTTKLSVVETFRTPFCLSQYSTEPELVSDFTVSPIA